jgi:hypothetical protein
MICINLLKITLEASFEGFLDLIEIINVLNGFKPWWRARPNTALL